MLWDFDEEGEDGMVWHSKESLGWLRSEGIVWVGEGRGGFWDCKPCPFVCVGDWGLERRVSIVVLAQSSHTLSRYGLTPQVSFFDDPLC